jgi:flagellar motor switch protein FliG
MDARENAREGFWPRQGAQVLERIQAQLHNHGRAARLRNADPVSCGNMLRGEHPQAVALIPAHLDPQHTAAILKELDSEVGSEVVYRMAKMEKVQPRCCSCIEKLAERDSGPTMTRA